MDSSHCYICLSSCFLYSLPGEVPKKCKLKVYAGDTPTFRYQDHSKALHSDSSNSRHNIGDKPSCWRQSVVIEYMMSCAFMYICRFKINLDPRALNSLY